MLNTDLGDAASQYATDRRAAHKLLPRESNREAGTPAYPTAATHADKLLLSYMILHFECKFIEKVHLAQTEYSSKHNKIITSPLMHFCNLLSRGFQSSKLHLTTPDFIPIGSSYSIPSSTLDTTVCLLPILFSPKSFYQDC